MLVDLHIHSHFSDGTQPPEEIVRFAKNQGILAISITDHDTVSGTDNAISAGEKYGLEVFPGVEVSSYLDDISLHILGYCMNYKDPNLLSSLQKLQEARETRNSEILERLQKNGVQIQEAELRSVSCNGQTGRPHFAKLLVEKGVVRDMREAFDLYLKKGCPAYVPRFIFSALEAIDIIRGAGGYAVLAHPVQIDSTLELLPDILMELVPHGLSGIELNYPTHSDRAKKKIRRLSRKYDLLYTGGSDYHGEMRPGTSMAKGKKMMIPDEVLAQLRKKWIINQGLK